MNIDKLKSLFYQTLSSLFFSILGMQVKLLSQKINIEVIVFYRCLIGLFLIIIFFAFQYKKKKFNYLKTPNIFLQIIRSIFGVFAMYFGYSALSFIPLAQASTIGFTKVFFVSILAIIFFSEKLTKEVLFFSILGFVGTYLILNPEELISSNGTILSLISSFFVAAGIISSVKLLNSNKTITIIFYHSFFSTVLCGVIFFSEISYLSLYDLFQLTLLTIIALIGQFLNMESYKYEKTSFVILFSYSRVIFSFLLGYFILQENIELINIMGILIIIVSTYLVSKIRNSQKSIIMDKGNG